MNHAHRRPLAAALALAFPLLAHAGYVELQGNAPAQPKPLPAGPSSVVPQAPAAVASAGDATGSSVELQGVELSGNDALPTDVLLAALGDFKGRRYTLQSLDELAQRIPAAYRANGFPFVRATLPPQRIRDGVLHIEVLEGTIGSANATGTDPKSPDAQPFIAAGIPTGEIIRELPLERTMLILNDEPGFKVHPSLRPGAQRGQSDLEVEVTRVNHVSGEVGLDNTGAASTGRNRLHVQLDINSPFRFGDQIAIDGMATDKDMWLGSLAYEAPVGHDGARARGSFSRTSYQLTGAFAALDSSGYADIAGLRATWPLRRSQNANLVLSADLQHKSLSDHYFGGALSSAKTSNLLIAGMQFDRRDGLGAGGVTFGQATLAAGALSLDADARTIDSSTTRSNGHFLKFNLDIARIQQLSDAFSAYARLSGQVGSKNLDASEKYGIGGYLGVRAYPMGEGTGDNAWLSQWELRYAAAPAATVFAFADGGQAFVNAKPWDAASEQRRTLAGAGAGLRWLQGAWSIESTLGSRLHGGAPQSETGTHPLRWFALVTYRF